MDDIRFEQIARVDAQGKACGTTAYMSDLSFPGMLYAWFVRSKYPHALIKSIDVSKAMALDGVVTVLTASDVTGFNGFGIVTPDMPVICSDTVRYMGDTVALVAATTERIAEQAAALVDVEYEVLPVVDDPIEALKPDAPKVHDKGNVCLHTLITKGDVEQGLREADVVIEHEYRTPRQAHTPLETESGVAVPEADGSLSMYAGSQYAFRDQLQIARILGMNPRMIHVYSNPVGGGFGGKDELTIQGGIALLAMKTGKPVKVFLSREESLVSGWKRHPFIVRMKTGFKSDGTMLANDVVCYEDKGAYTSLGGPVLNLALEHASSLYRVPNTRHEGWAVFTNNGICGAFRGFGVPQVLFALESNMDEAAEKLGLDPVTIRRRNVLHQGEVSPIGHTLRTGVSMDLVLDAIEKSDLWQHREEYKKTDRPWLRRGVAPRAGPSGSRARARDPRLRRCIHRSRPGRQLHAPHRSRRVRSGHAYRVHADGRRVAARCLVEGPHGGRPDGGLGRRRARNRLALDVYGLECHCRSLPGLWQEGGRCIGCKVSYGSGCGL